MPRNQESRLDGAPKYPYAEALHRAAEESLLEAFVISLLRAPE